MDQGSCLIRCPFWVTSIFEGGFECWELCRTLKQVEQSEISRRESEEDIRLLGFMSE